MRGSRHGPCLQIVSRTIWLHLWTVGGSGDVNVPFLPKLGSTSCGLVWNTYFFRTNKLSKLFCMFPSFIRGRCSFHSLQLQLLVCTARPQKRPPVRLTWQEWQSPPLGLINTLLPTCCQTGNIHLHFHSKPTSIHSNKRSVFIYLNISVFWSEFPSPARVSGGFEPGTVSHLSEKFLQILVFFVPFANFEYQIQVFISFFHQHELLTFIHTTTSFFSVVVQHLSSHYGTYELIGCDNRFQFFVSSQSAHEINYDKAG